MITGTLQKCSASSAPPPITPIGYWNLTITVDNREYFVFTSSRIVLAVLNTAILTGAKWKIQIDTNPGPPPLGEVITRVRILDDKSVCKTVEKLPAGQPIQPLTPTAFAELIPRKWGFFLLSAANVMSTKE